MNRILEGVIRRPVAGRRVAFSGLVLGIVISLVSAGVAFADNVQNDISINGGDSFNAGGSTAIGYRIHATNGDGLNGCNASDGTPATVTINTPPAVTVTPNPLSFSVCETFQDATFSSSVPGNYQITVSVSDTGAGTYNTNPATFTLKVLAPADTTPPAITPNVSGTLGSNGWYVSDVNVSWTVSDAQSAISSSSGCGPSTVNTDTASQTFTCSATSGGGTSSQSVTIKRDATAPTISGSASPGPNAYGWNNSAVTVSFSGTDVLSGIDSCDADVVLSSEGAGQSASGSCTDEAGNSASATASGINIDLTPPSVNLVGGPADGASYPWGYVPAEPGCSASDAPSGLAPPGCSVSGYSSAVGTHTVTATAYDKAGNMATASATYTVLAWSAYGFYRPVDMGYMNTVKGGSTVPIKFEVFAGATELTGGADPWTVVKSLSAVQTSCNGTLPSAPVEELAATGGTTLRYDWTDGQFVFNWKTPKMPGKCYKFTATLQDGSSITADFSLK